MNVLAVPQNAQNVMVQILYQTVRSVLIPTSSFEMVATKFALRAIMVIEKLELVTVNIC